VNIPIDPPTRAKLDDLLARPFYLPGVLEQAYTSRLSEVYSVGNRIGEAAERVTGCDDDAPPMYEQLDALEQDALVLLWAIREARKFVKDTNAIINAPEPKSRNGKGAKRR
jgi:hypothetical protein